MLQDVDSPRADAGGHDTVFKNLLSVEVAGYRVGVPAEAVVEIHAAARLAPLPDAPDVVVGVVNRRGSCLPVLSLRRRLGLPARPLHVDDNLVVLRLVDREVVLLVDAAVDLVTVEAGDIDTAATTTTRAVYTQGVAVLPDGLLVIVDPQAFLSADEASALQHALRTAARRAQPGAGER